jgi:hypothetical protein
MEEDLGPHLPEGPMSPDFDRFFKWIVACQLLDRMLALTERSN